MALLSKLTPDAAGITDIYRQGTYGGGIIPRDNHGDLAFSAVLARPASYTLETYELIIILMTGGFAD